MAKKGNVLVVDDEEVMRDVLESLLSQDGYRVDLAKTGEEGLARFGERTYDAVLLDVSMPGIGGLRTLEEMLKLDREAVVDYDHGVRDIRYRHRRLGDGRFQMHSQAI